MRKSILLILLILIASFGLVLRFVNYDSIPPFAETQDEFFYPWAGMTWLRTGTPTAWSWFPSYPKREVVTKWGIMFPVVSPWVEKPPLYTLIQGVWMVVNGYRDIFEVRLTTVRVIPVVISFFTIILTGLLAKKVFSDLVGLISALLFAIVPTIVMANRLSLTENLLSPLILITLIVFLADKKWPHWKVVQPILVGIGAFLMLNTKNIALAPIAVLLLIYFQKKQWRDLLIVFLFSAIGFIIHPAIGFLFDWKLYTSVMQDYRSAFVQAGLPELVNTLFLHPTIGRKDHFFLDGSMLAGYILLFSSPFWLLGKYKDVTQNTFNQNFQVKLTHLFTSNKEDNDNSPKWKIISLLLFPLLYVALLAVLASGIGFSFYGWHVYPLYPFLMILLAKALSDLWENFEPVSLISIVLILGSSTVRQIFMFVPEIIRYNWQYALAALFSLSFMAWVVPDIRFRRVVMFGLFYLFVGANIYTIINLSQIFPPIPQPLQ